MIVPGQAAATLAGATSAGRDDEIIIFDSERSRVFRRFVGVGSVVYKQLLGPDAARRVRHETAMLERLSAIPGIVKLSAATDGAETPANSIALEDYLGVQLSKVLRSERLGVDVLLDVALQLAKTIAAMHRLGIMHRDINPSNILLVGPRRRPVLIDFDIASTFAQERPAFTAQSEIAGTLAYIPPEQTGRTGRVMDQRSDLYSLGATLYELATGHTPFEGDDPFQLIRDHLVRVATSPAALDPDTPPALSDIIMRLLQKEPDRRYQSAEGLAGDLSRLIERRAYGVSGPFPLGEHDFPQRLLPPSRLVGREAEIGALHTAFEDALAGRRNGLLVAGASGVGKTALINELRSIVTAAGGWFVKGKFDQYSEDAKSGAALGAFRDLTCLLLAEPEEELVPLRARLLRTLGANATFAAAMFPELALLLGIGAAPASDRQNGKERLAQTWLDLLNCVASPTRPVVFVLDDLQWASAGVFGFMDAVISQTNAAGLLMVGAYRTTDVDAAHPLSALLLRWKRLNAAPRELTLNALRPSDLRDLLHDMLRLPPSQAAKLAEAVDIRTHGNPYDTVEMINALRKDGALTPGLDGWTWDEATIQRFVGQGDVVDLLSVRIDALPPDCRALLEVMAALGGDVELPLLQAAAEFSAAALEERLTPALDDGLLLLEHGAAGAVRFRHDRVQQAAYGRLESDARLQLHLTLARRLAAASEYDGIAAEQYLYAGATVQTAEERLRSVALFRKAAARASLLGNYAAAERFLAAALTMLGSVSADSDAPIVAVENELHAALYGLGRFDKADVIYRSIERRDGSALELVDAACVQISSLTNRNLARQAVSLGIDLLRRLGFAPPEQDLGAAIEGRLNEIYRWSGDKAARTADLRRLDATEPGVIGAAKLIARLIAAAFFSDRAILAWLVLQSLRLWSEYGPQAALVGPLSLAGHATITLGGDYRTGYRTARHVLAVSEARGYEPETSLSRFYFALGIEHWFEPFEDCVEQAHLAYGGLLRGGDLQNACFTYAASIPLLLQCAATVEEYSLEVAAGLAFSVRTRNEQARETFTAYRQLARSLRGETNSPGSFTDASFDEEAHLAGLGTNQTAAVHFHIARALAGLLFGQTADLVRHANAALPLLPLITVNTLTGIAHTLNALAAARSLHSASANERPALLEELDRSRDWLRRRTDDAPQNFLHSLRLVEAERAWAVADFQTASFAFEAALRQVRPRRSLRHRALIAERAALFYAEHGLERYGRLLLTDARQLYAEWGATAKVRQLEREFPALLNAAPAVAERRTLTTTLSSDTIDMVGILRASQALSSQTTLESLKAKVVELVAALTGATAVLLVVRGDETDDWLFSPADDRGAAPLSVKEAGARGLLPLTAFRYVERTHEPLLIADAIEDDRFARDPYFAGCEQCSMLVVPILSQGEPRAVLLLENRLSRGAFSTSRLDAVMLIAGQLAVSLDNALLYASLERKVADRTEALAAANEQLSLLSLTDALTGLVNRRGFDQKLDAEWLRARRTRTSLGLAMIDIDKFKTYNDRFGHPAGDDCLRRIAQTLKDGLRPASDLAARYGGEEFVLILPDTGLEGTYSAAERRRAAVAALREPDVHGIVTVSMGVVAVVPSDDDSVARFVEAADVALYEAKHKGRNQVVRAVRTTP